VVLVEPLNLPPNTTVEVLIIPEPQEDGETTYWERLADLGLLTTGPTESAPEAFEPIPIQGEPISETIIQERR
jgi:hypothetical protein